MRIEVIDITSYQSFVESHANAVIHFWAEWNLYDGEMRERLSTLSDVYAGLIEFASFDTSPEEHWKKCHELQISNLPTLVLYKNGKHFETVVGLRVEEETKINLNHLLNA